MKVKEFQKKSITELNSNLLDLLREHFHLRMQNTNSQIKQTHLLKQVRRNIARVKTLLSEKMKH